MCCPISPVRPDRARVGREPASLNPRVGTSSRHDEGTHDDRQARPARQNSALRRQRRRRGDVRCARAGRPGRRSAGPDPGSRTRRRARCAGPADGCAGRSRGRGATAPPAGPPMVPQIPNAQYGSGDGPLGFLRDAWHQARDPYGFMGNTEMPNMPPVGAPPPGAGPPPPLPPGYKSLNAPGSETPATAPAAGGPALPPGYFPSAARCRRDTSGVCRRHRRRRTRTRRSRTCRWCPRHRRRCSRRSSAGIRQQRHDASGGAAVDGGLASIARVVAADGLLIPCAVMKKSRSSRFPRRPNRW